MADFIATCVDINDSHKSNTLTSIATMPKTEQNEKHNLNHGFLFDECTYGNPHFENSLCDPVSKNHSLDEVLMLYGCEEAQDDEAKCASDTGSDIRPIHQAQESETTIDYGYEEAAPDIARYDDDHSNASSSINHRDLSSFRSSNIDYGYEHVSPGTTDMYGYEEAVPNQVDAAIYGYGDAAPDSAQREKGNESQHSSRSVGRRSSMKTAGAPRRSSISYRGEVENILPGKRRACRRTSIGFDDSSTQVLEVTAAKDMVENPDQLWFQRKEYNLIREKASLLTSLAKNTMGDPAQLERIKMCLRGLESHIDADYVEYEQNLAWDTVFLEQINQQAEGAFDDEVVASLYEMATMPSRARAWERAQGDSIEAAKHTRTIRRKATRRCSNFT